MRQRHLKNKSTSGHPLSSRGAHRLERVDVRARPAHGALPVLRGHSGFERASVAREAARGAERPLATRDAAAAGHAARHVRAAPSASRALCVNSSFRALSSFSASRCLGWYTIAASAPNAHFLPCSLCSMHSFSPRGSQLKCVAAACVFSSFPASGISSCNTPCRSKICRRSAVPLTARYCPIGDHACFVGPEPRIASKSGFIARVRASAKARLRPSTRDAARRKRVVGTHASCPQRDPNVENVASRAVATGPSLASGSAPRAGPMPARDGLDDSRARRAPHVGVGALVEGVT